LVSAAAWSAPDSVALPGEQAFPESVTSTHDGRLYAGSLATGGIVRIRPGSAPEVWIKPGAFGTASIFGVLADEHSNTLWACSNDLSARGVVIAGADKGSVLKGFDLKTGEGKVSVAFAGEKNLCNDIAIGADGSAYVTNTMSPQILKLAPGDNKLQVWFTDPSLQPAAGAGLDGLAFGSDGNLYVDRYTPADLYRIEVKNGKAGALTPIHTSRALILTDAIRPLGGNSFLIIEGGGRLDIMKITNDSASFETLKDGFAVPTGVTRMGNTAWVSEGQLNLFFDPANKGKKPSLPFHLFAVPIPK
jgi:sugar lactone lactonase YvrE